MTEARVTVVGGGLAGLVAARHLADAGADVTLYERESTVGGRVTTRREDGYVLDRGFQVLFTAYPAVQRELDLDALDLRRFKPGAVIARPGERSILSDPLRDPAALAPSLFNHEVTTRDKLRVLTLRRELSAKSPADIFDGDDRSIRSYLQQRGFSEGFVEHFAAPFYGGITLDRSLADTSSRVFEYTFRALSKGAIAVPAAGMAAIPEQLAEHARAAGVAVHTGSEVTAVDADAGGATVETGGETHAVDAVVVAADPPTARDLTGVEAIPTEGRACVTQYYALPGSTDLDAGKRILLNAGTEAPNTVVDHSAVAPEYAPEDVTLLGATFLGDRAESDDELAETAREAVASWYPEHSFSSFDVVHTSRVPFAQFDQPPGFRESLPAVTSPDGRAYLAGDYTAWSSINGAMESGRRAAEAALADLDVA